METHRGKEGLSLLLWWLINDSQGASKPSLLCCNNRLRSEKRHATKSFHCCLSVFLFFLPVTVEPLSVNMFLIWSDYSSSVRLSSFLCHTHQFDWLLENSGNRSLQFQANLGHLKLTSISPGHGLWIHYKLDSKQKLTLPEIASRNSASLFEIKKNWNYYYYYWKCKIYKILITS